jgi:hypothetical protein
MVHLKAKTRGKARAIDEFLEDLAINLDYNNKAALQKPRVAES